MHVLLLLCSVSYCVAVFNLQQTLGVSFDRDFVLQTEKNYTLISNAETKDLFVVYDGTAYPYKFESQRFGWQIPKECVKIENFAPITDFSAIAISKNAEWDWSLHPKDMETKCWMFFVNEYQKQYSSQGPQDGLLEYVFSNIGVSENRYYVEFGYPKKQGSNTWHLNWKHGFKGLIMDGGHPENEELNVRTEFITSHNIIQLFKKHKVPKVIDYISIDIDSTDLWVFRKILRSPHFKPRLVSVEYNVNFPHDATIACHPDPSICHWTACRMFGNSMGALNLVANEHNYTAIGVVSGLDVFFVSNDALDDLHIKPEYDTLKSGTGWAYLKRCVEKYGEEGEEILATFPVDYANYQKTRNISQVRVKSALAGYISTLLVYYPVLNCSFENCGIGLSDD